MSSKLRLSKLMGKVQPQNSEQEVCKELVRLGLALPSEKDIAENGVNIQSGLSDAGLWGDIKIWEDDAALSKQFSKEQHTVRRKLYKKALGYYMEPC
ncbi:hypothetical protein AB4262_10740 [Vibrio breoganii]